MSDFTSAPTLSGLLTLADADTYAQIGDNPARHSNSRLNSLYLIYAQSMQMPSAPTAQQPLRFVQYVEQNGPVFVQHTEQTGCGA